jgi:hypothetical protein
MSYKKKIKNSKNQSNLTAIAQVKEFVTRNSSMAKSWGIEEFEKNITGDTTTDVNAVEELLEKIGEDTGEDGVKVKDSEIDAAISVMSVGANENVMNSYISGSASSIGDNYEVFGQSGGDVVGERVSMEEFSEQKLQNSLDISMLFNVRGQNQGPLAELFFRTSVLPVETPYAKFEFHVPKIVKNRKRVINSTTAHNYVRLLDAAINPALLNDRSTDAIPVYQTGGGSSTQAYFVTGYPSYVLNIGGEDVTTAPLKLNTTVNLINLSARAGLVANSVLDNTDALEAAMRTNVLIGQRGTGGSAQFIRFPTSNLTEYQFQPADNSTGDKVIFSSTDKYFATVTSETADVAGNPAFPTLSPTYEGYKILLATSVSGEFNLHSGTGSVNGGGAIRVIGYTTPGSEIIETSANAALETALGLTIVGYEARARRTNLAKRVDGTLITSLPIREAYRIELGAPLFAQIPLGTPENKGREIATSFLITSARLRGKDLAVTKLIETAEAMENQTMVASALGETTYFECEGISRHLIRPRFIKRTIDFDDGSVVSSLKSHERAADVSAALVNQIRTLSMDLWVQSNMETAFQFAADQGDVVKPVLAIGTSPTIVQHLVVTGDTRLTGIRFDYQVATDMDSRLTDKIFLAFVSDHEYLTFGRNFWVAEMVTDLPISRDSRITRELQVQPRNRFLVTLPVLGLIETVNLSKALLDPTIPTIPVSGL